MTERFYVTTPIYYVNDAPHIGHSYTTILADVLARYHRLLGHETRFQTGTDEHGTKVQLSAAKRGVTPIQQCDEYSQRFVQMWQTLGIEYDTFIRTTQSRHYQVVQTMLQKIYDQGDIFKDTYKGWYNIRSEMFIADSEVDQEEVAAGRIVQMEETNYFFRLSNYQEWLQTHLSQHPDFILPETRRNEVLGMLRDPLPNLCISRPKERLAWGIPIPFDHDYVTYVWFDALINYVTGIGYGTDEQEFNKWWPACTHLIGKDILKPHGIFWPIMLKAAGAGIFKRLVVHGWWTRGGQKESKTLSAGLAAQAPVRHIRELVQDYGAEPIRYFLMREMTLGMDQDYDELILVLRLNADLANDLGNLASRTLKIVQRDLGGKTPAAGPLSEAENEIITLAQKAQEKIKPAIETFKLNHVIEAVMEMVRAANRYFNATKPWDLLKEGNLQAAGRICYVSMEVLRWASVALGPVMPTKMLELRRQLGLSEQVGLLEQELVWGGLPSGGDVPGGDPLFPKIDDKAVKLRLKAESEQAAAQMSEPGLEGLISIEEFGKVQLRTAIVLEAEVVPKADKLLKLKIQIGAETRQIVAGIAQFYRPEELPGKRIAVVANLKPAKIRGLDSYGMLLAAKHEGKLCLLTTDDPQFSSGATVS